MTRELRALGEREGRPAVVTAGRWTVEPGEPSVVPGLARFSLDLRHPDLAVRDRPLDGARRARAAWAGRRGRAGAAGAAAAPRPPGRAVLARRLGGGPRLCAAVAERHGVAVDVVRDKDEEP